MAGGPIRKKHVDPRRAIAFVRGRRQGNAVPALLWLYIALLGLVILRRGQLPDGSQVITFGLLGGGVIAAGAIAPAPVGLVLVAMLIAAVLGVAPALTNVVDRATGAVASAFGR